MSKGNVKLLNREEAANYLGLSPNTLTAWAQHKDYNGLPIIKLGRSVRYKLEDLELYVEKKRKTENNE